MAEIIHTVKACSTNPLKMSQPIGAALAFMGINRAMPLLHGSQGCTSFGLVLFVRHFREAIPLQTTAMNEVATILGGYDNVEKAIINISNRVKPEFIGICSTGVTEIKGDDLDGYLRTFRETHPELDHVKIVFVSGPDFKGAFQDGWAAAVKEMVTKLVTPVAAGSGRDPNKVAVLPGCHLTPGDLDELRDVFQCFGLEPFYLPDLSGSLDGHVPDEFTPTTLGGISVGDIAALGQCGAAIALGEQMRGAAEALEKIANMPVRLFDRLTGLAAFDEFVMHLAQISGRPVPTRLRRQRAQLVDAMLDGQFHIGGKRIAIGAEPDLLFGIGQFLTEMGAVIGCAVTTTNAPKLAELNAATVIIGDMEDLEEGAKSCDMVITNSQGKRIQENLGIPLLRMGIPMFDRLGAAHQISVGYRGTRDLIFTVGNAFLDALHEVDHTTWAVCNRDQSGAGPNHH